MRIPPYITSSIRLSFPSGERSSRTAGHNLFEVEDPLPRADVQPSYAENRAGRAANQLVCTGPEPAEKPLHPASSDDEQISTVLGHSLNDPVDQSDGLRDLKWNSHTGPLGMNRELLARFPDQKGVSSVRSAAWKSRVDAGDRVHHMKSRPELFNELVSDLEDPWCPRPHVDGANH